MTSNKTVTVLTPNGRRQNVKVTPNTTILQILEEVCKKQGFQSEEYDLKHHNHVLDTTSTMRFSGLPNNAQLEMATALKTREESTVVLGLHLESGDRVMGNFMPAASLWDVINKLCPEEADPDSNPVIIYMRREVSGAKHLQATTLRCLGLTGGRALLRYVHGTPEQLHRQANVSGPLQQRPPPEVVEKETKSLADPYPAMASTSAPQTFHNPPSVPYQPPSTSSHQEHTTAMEVDEPAISQSESLITLSEDVSSQVSSNSVQAEPVAAVDVEKLDGEIVLLGERNAIVFSLEMAQSVPYEDLPEDFYNLTTEDARAIYRDIKRARAELEEAPLMTSGLRELEASKRVLNHLGSYKRAVLRVQFPDRTVLQGTFLPLETISIVEKFVAQYLDNPATRFHLYTTPPKTVLAPDARLVEVGCVPSCLVHFGLDASQPDNGKYLRPELLTRLTSPNAAALVANRSRGLMDTSRPSSAVASTAGASSSFTNPVPSTSTARSDSAGPSTSQQPPRPDYGPSGKVPKWFKVTK